MGENSKIEWTDHTFNPWVGCTKVSPACDHCYAEGWAKRSNQVEWGAGKPRKRTSAANWRQPLKWNREAEAAGIRPRVFCASLADVFDNEVADEWRVDLWALIRETPNLDWLIVTKRIGNAAAMLPKDWGDGWPNVWLLATVSNQDEADRDIPKLLQTPAVIRGLSIEPLLGLIDFYTASNSWAMRGYKPWMNTPVLTGIDWVIVGGESGQAARRMREEWVLWLREQCRETGTAFFFKQWGEFDRWGVKVGKKSAGRLLPGILEGETADEYPQVPGRVACLARIHGCASECPSKPLGDPQQCSIEECRFRAGE